VPALVIRSWPPLRPLLIHASKSWRYLGNDYADVPPVEHLDFGALVGVVEVGCVLLADVERDPFAVAP
jgi:hypothetical protein